MGSFYSYYDRYSLSHAKKNQSRTKRLPLRRNDSQDSGNSTSSQPPVNAVPDMLRRSGRGAYGGSNRGSNYSRTVLRSGTSTPIANPRTKTSGPSSLTNMMYNSIDGKKKRKRELAARTVQNADADRAKQAYLAAQRNSQSSRQETRERVFPQRPFSRPTIQQLRKPTEDKKPALPVSPALMAQALGFTPGDEKAIEWIRKHPNEALAAIEDSIRRGDPRWKSGNIGGTGNPAIMKTILGNLNSRRSQPNYPRKPYNR